MQSQGGNQFMLSTGFNTTADATGNITVYTWSDPNSPQVSDTQGASLLNGFTLTIPEPASSVLFAVGLLGAMVTRRRRLTRQAVPVA